MGTIPTVIRYMWQRATKRYLEKNILFDISQTWNHTNVVRRVYKYQRGNQNPYIEEEQTTQWPIERVQKDKQRSTKHTHKTKDRVIIPLYDGSLI